MSINAALREHGQSVAAAILGVDRLYAAHQSAEVAAGADLLRRETPVAINLSRVPAESFTDWAEAARRWKELRAAAASLADPVRRAHYEDLADSLLEMVRWQAAGSGHEAGGHNTGAAEGGNVVAGGSPASETASALGADGLAAPAFAAQGQRLLGLARLPFSDDEFHTAQQDVRAQLEAGGHDAATLSDLPAALTRWEEAHMVDGAQAPQVLAALLQEGRERVERQLFPLPAHRTMVAVAEYDVAYSAYCDFEAGEMRVNFDQTYTLPELRHLVAHEAYPGHLTHLAVRETAAAAGEAAEDTLLVVTDTPTSPIFEGIGDNGLAFCWERDQDDEIQAAVGRMRTMAACRAAWRLAAGLAEDEVRVALAAESLAAPSWVHQRMRFVNYPLRRPFIYAYAWGERLVRGCYAHVPEGQRQTFLRHLYQDPHSPRSLHLLEEAVSS